VVARGEEGSLGEVMRRGGGVVSVSVSGSVGRRFKSRRRHFFDAFTLSKLFTRIYSVSSTEGLKMCGIAGTVMSADRISGFLLNVAFRIALKMRSLLLLL